MSTTETTYAKSFPRFLQTSRRTSDELVRPLPPSLMRLVAETPEGTRHNDLAARYSEMRTRIVALTTAVQTAEAADREAERRAAEKGTKRPRPKADAVREELELEREQLVTLEGLIAESARDLLRVAVARVAEADEQASIAVEHALDAARDALHAADAAFTLAGELAAESGWISGLKLEGIVYPWRSGRSAPPAPTSLNFLRSALGAFEHDIARSSELRESAERLREHDEAQALPAGVVVWREGQSFRVSDDGTLEAVER